MWNIAARIGLLLITTCSLVTSRPDVSHLTGYLPPTLEEGGASNIDGTITGLPTIAPPSPVYLPDRGTEGSSLLPTGIKPVDPHDHSKDHDHDHSGTHHDHHHHYHGQDGKYDPNDDGTGWDIRLSVPGEPGRDYPTLDTIPVTSFDCAGRHAGYYADIQSGCQVFRVCNNSPGRGSPFLCPNGTIFSQAITTCDWWKNVDCGASSKYFYKNDEIGQPTTGSSVMSAIRQMLIYPMNNPYKSTSSEPMMEYTYSLSAETLPPYEPDNNGVELNPTGSQSQFNIKGIASYLPPKQITTTTRKYYTPTVPTTQRPSTPVYNYIGQNSQSSYQTGSIPSNTYVPQKVDSSQTSGVYETQKQIPYVPKPLPTLPPLPKPSVTFNQFGQNSPSTLLTSSRPSNTYVPQKESSSGSSSIAEVQEQKPLPTLPPLPKPSVTFNQFGQNSQSTLLTSIRPSNTYVPQKESSSGSSIIPEVQKQKPLPTLPPLPKPSVTFNQFGQNSQSAILTSSRPSNTYVPQKESTIASAGIAEVQKQTPYVPVKPLPTLPPLPNPSPIYNQFEQSSQSNFESSIVPTTTFTPPKIDSSQSGVYENPKPTPFVPKPLPTLPPIPNFSQSNIQSGIQPSNTYIPQKTSSASQSSGQYESGQQAVLTRPLPTLPPVPRYRPSVPQKPIQTYSPSSQSGIPALPIAPTFSSVGGVQSSQHVVHNTVPVTEFNYHSNGNGYHQLDDHSPDILQEYRQQQKYTYPHYDDEANGVINSNVDVRFGLPKTKESNSGFSSTVRPTTFSGYSYSKPSNPLPLPEISSSSSGSHIVDFGQISSSNNQYLVPSTTSSPVSSSSSAIITNNVISANEEFLNVNAHGSISTSGYNYPVPSTTPSSTITSSGSGAANEASFLINESGFSSTSGLSNPISSTTPSINVVTSGSGLANIQSSGISSTSGYSYPTPSITLSSSSGSSGSTVTQSFASGNEALININNQGSSSTSGYKYPIPTTTASSAVVSGNEDLIHINSQGSSSTSGYNYPIPSTTASSAIVSGNEDLIHINSQGSSSTSGYNYPIPSTTASSAIVSGNEDLIHINSQGSSSTSGYNYPIPSTTASISVSSGNEASLIVNHGGASSTSGYSYPVPSTTLSTNVISSGSAQTNTQVSDTDAFLSLNSQSQGSSSTSGYNYPVPATTPSTELSSASHGSVSSSAQASLDTFNNQAHVVDSSKVSIPSSTPSSPALINIGSGSSSSVASSGYDYPSPTTPFSLPNVDASLINNRAHIINTDFTAQQTYNQQPVQVDESLKANSQQSGGPTPSSVLQDINALFNENGKNVDSVSSQEQPLSEKEIKQLINARFSSDSTNEVSTSNQQVAVPASHSQSGHANYNGGSSSLSTGSRNTLTASEIGAKINTRFSSDSGSVSPSQFYQSSNLQSSYPSYSSNYQTAYQPSGQHNLGQYTVQSYGTPLQSVNNLYRQKTVVELTPSIAFSLDSDSGRQEYVSAVLGGLLDSSRTAPSPYSTYAHQSGGNSGYLAPDYSHSGHTSYTAPLSSVGYLGAGSSSQHLYSGPVQSNVQSSSSQLNGYPRVRPAIPFEY